MIPVNMQGQPGSPGTDGPDGTPGTPGSKGRMAEASGWFFVPDSPPSRGGVGGNGAVKEGVGLSNTRARLRELYGETHRFELVRGPAGGVRVEVSIPFCEERLLQ